jgi:hypothetical protein
VVAGDPDPEPGVHRDRARDRAAAPVAAVLEQKLDSSAPARTVAIGSSVAYPEQWVALVDIDWVNETDFESRSAIAAGCGPNPRAAIADARTTRPTARLLCAVKATRFDPNDELIIVDARLWTAQGRFADLRLALDTGSSETLVMPSRGLYPRRSPSSAPQSAEGRILVERISV